MSKKVSDVNQFKSEGLGTEGQQYNCQSESSGLRIRRVSLSLSL